ncbi:NAD(P)-dependent oxidoreductase [Streptomyces sp. NPDC051940]|uniref:NAD(P)-dependent oxidoreductase n=1 Tax=Streptomyces sp. NPDC051940 TaxID=3155675 RepID=UPI003426CF0D
MRYDDFLTTAELLADPGLGPEVHQGLARAAGREPRLWRGEVPAGAFVYVGHGLPAALRTDGLRWFHSTFAGNDAVLRGGDWPPGALLTRTVGRMTERIAQYVLGWVLADAQYVPEYVDRQARAEWRCVPGELVAGRLAVVHGTGRIGSAVGALLGRVGVRTVGVARRPRPVEGFAEVVDAERADSLLGEASWIVNVLPLTPQTEGYFDARRFGAMRGAMYVNVGRGATTDLAALEAALEAGRVRRAVLDVVPDEPADPDALCWRLPHTVVTSHSAGITADEDVVADFAACLAALREGRRPELTVDVGAGY